MKQTLSLREAAPENYVEQLSLHHPDSRSAYRSILNGFRRFVTNDANGRLSQTVIREWLHNRSLVWPFRRLADNVRRVDRYLDWAVAQGGLVENPLAKLRKKYGQQTTAPLVRALLNADPRIALEALRPVPRFGSFLGPLMREHLELMRALGHRYDLYEGYMLSFDRFLQRRTDLTGQPLPALMHEWRQTKPTPGHALRCQRLASVLHKAVSRVDPSCPKMAWRKRIEREAYQHHRKPCIFSHEEVRRIFATARTFPSPQSPLRTQGIYAMLVLAYCAGLRVGEIVRLNLGDVDLENGIIQIRQTKFFKTRHLPLSSSATAALRSFIDARNRAGAPIESLAGLFWNSCNRGPGRYCQFMVEDLLRCILRRAGLKPAKGKGKVGPRVHDLRHTFVVHRMLKWYQEGINPQPYLPYLATYLGHKDINSTLVYITVTQELLQRAGERFRQRSVVALLGAEGGQQ